MATKKRSTAKQSTPAPDHLNIGLAYVSWYATAERKEWRDLADPADWPAIELRAQGNRENIREWLLANGIETGSQGVEESWTAWIIEQMFYVIRDMLIPALKLRRSPRGRARAQARKQFEKDFAKRIRSTVVYGLFETGGAPKKTSQMRAAYEYRAERQAHYKRTGLPIGKAQRLAKADVLEKFFRDVHITKKNDLFKSWMKEGKPVTRKKM